MVYYRCLVVKMNMEHNFIRKHIRKRYLGVSIAGLAASMQWYIEHTIKKHTASAVQWPEDAI